MTHDDSGSPRAGPSRLRPGAARRRRSAPAGGGRGPSRLGPTRTIMMPLGIRVMYESSGSAALTPTESRRAAGGSEPGRPGLPAARLTESEPLHAQPARLTDSEAARRRSNGPRPQRLSRFGLVQYGPGDSGGPDTIVLSRNCRGSRARQTECSSQVATDLTGPFRWQSHGQVTDIGEVESR